MWDTGEEQSSPRLTLLPCRMILTSHETVMQLLLDVFFFFTILTRWYRNTKKLGLTRESEKPNLWTCGINFSHFSFFVPESSGFDESFLSIPVDDSQRAVGVHVIYFYFFPFSCVWTAFNEMGQNMHVRVTTELQHFFCDYLILWT